MPIANALIMTSLQLDDREKSIFEDWLLQREKVLLDELNVLKSLQAKLKIDVEVKASSVQVNESKTVAKPIATTNKNESSSWVNIIKTELKHFTHPVPSGEIVKRLLNKPSISEKGKRFITKAVTSKLWLLQERGEVIKSRENGKYVYALKH